MAVKISQLPASSPNGSLVLPVSDGITTGKVTVSQVCGVVTAGQITTSLGYIPYNSTNPNGYISNGVDSLVSGTLPVAGGFNTQSSFELNTGSLTQYKILKLILKDVSMTAGNTTLAINSYSNGCITHNNGSGSTGVWAHCTIDLIGGTLMSVSENSGQQYDTNGSYVFMKAHNYTPASTRITLYTSGATNYFDNGTYLILGLR